MTLEEKLTLTEHKVDALTNFYYYNKGLSKADKAVLIQQIDTLKDKVALIKKIQKTRAECLNLIEDLFNETSQEAIENIIQKICDNNNLTATLYVQLDEFEKEDKE